MSYDNRLKTTLDEISLKVFSGGTPLTKKEEFWNGEFSWLSSGETRHDFITKTEKSITQEGIDGSSTRLAKKGDIVIASAGQGNTRGQTSFCKINTYINQSIVAIRCNPQFAHNMYVYYNIKNRYNELRAISDGHSIRGSLTTKLIKGLDIELPPLQEQKAIAKILSSLDDKIEINNKINKNLEEMAQALYKQWFVNFEFPNEEGEPYKSSGGEMIESELGFIPKGWEVKSLLDLVLKCNEKVTPDINKKIIDMASMPSYSIALSNFETGNKLSTNTFKMNKYSFLYGSIRPYLGKFGVAPFDGITTGTVHNFIVQHDFDYSYVASIVFSRKFNEFCIKLSHGTKMPVIKWCDFVSYKISYSQSISKIFNISIRSIFDKIVINVLENIKLSNLRDILLPKLMNGEIEVTIEE